MVFFSSKPLHFYQTIPPEILTYYLLLITYYLLLITSKPESIDSMRQTLTRDNALIVVIPLEPVVALVQ